MKPQLYFSVDIETDGPIPAVNSMLSFGCVALTEDGEELGAFSANLRELPGAAPDEETMKWWAENPKAWEACRLRPQDPAEEVKRFVEWVEQFKLNYDITMVAMPAGFDFMFMYWYMKRFAYSPFSFSCVDMKTFAMALRGKPYRKSTKSYWPRRWFPNLPHTHIALEDAREQGLTFISMLKERKLQKEHDETNK